MSKVEGAIKLHRDWYIDFVRIFLGLVLILKGIFFLNDMEVLMNLAGQEFESFKDYGLAYGTLAHVIIFINVLGGGAVMLGFLTRLAIPAQFPILLIALFSGPIKKVYFGGTMMELAMMLVLLIGIMVYGSGQFSVDYYLRMKRET